MFTIDLLKGQGIPIKSRPWGIAIVAVTVAIPTIVAVTMFGFYLNDKIIASIKKRAIVRCDSEINKLSDSVELQKSFEAERNNINSCLSEVSSSIGRHTQWSPILATVVKSMPDSMVLTRLEVKERSVRRKVPKKDDPQKMVDISVPARTLQMSISGRPQTNNDEAVKDFKDRLRFSALLGPQLENIGVSQQSGTLEGWDVASYEIDCVFKPRF